MYGPIAKKGLSGLPGPRHEHSERLSASDEARADTFGQFVHVRGTDPLVGRSLYQLKHLDSASVLRRLGNDMHMKVVETFLLGEKQHIRFWNLQFDLEGSRECWNEPSKNGSLIRRQLTHRPSVSTQHQHEPPQPSRVEGVGNAPKPVVIDPLVRAQSGLDVVLTRITAGDRFLCHQ